MFQEEKMHEAVESSENGGMSELQGCSGDHSSSEEELSLLPRHTKVVVTGNNRTKSVLVGLRGVVKKAVGLGGWHWLVLTNGMEVKLQRNALSVIEAPSHEEEEDLELENTQSQYNGLDMESNFTKSTRKSRHRSHRTSRKPVSRSFSYDLQSKIPNHTTCGTMKVDLSKLGISALWKYCRHFNLVDACPNPTKEQLINVVEKHFMSQQVDELEGIVGFVQAVQRMKPVSANADEKNRGGYRG